ncbi:hypothetical protein [Rhodovulum sulfidophilum]|uniref:hypothetical protein n=1 Tax=Rhodovulum sulfidophilum TaxID=35806 RepID=UPI001F2266FB|nr:hypothetical protein [Rhodovulum sulfidophilum]MCE8438883.1 hypothetical protein [Rhodovulum sulfidophilum]MCE8468803.1 hypothetical protein [Rhodovulum sulfidophilum]
MLMQNPPAILIQKTPSGLMPYGPHSGPMLDELVMGQVLTAKPRKGRTIPRNTAYWAGLTTAIENAEAWPTTRHLHDDLKRLCGYVDRYHYPLTGRDEVRVQSTAFNRMGESEFAAYFRLAQMRFAQQMGFDPWAMGRAA